MVGDLGHGVIAHDFEGFAIYDAHRAVSDVRDVDPLRDAGNPLRELRGSRPRVDVRFLCALVTRFPLLLAGDPPVSAVSSRDGIFESMEGWTMDRILACLTSMNEYPKTNTETRLRIPTNHRSRWRRFLVASRRFIEPFSLPSLTLPSLIRKKLLCSSGLV